MYAAAIEAENLAACGEHRAQEAWFDSQHGIVMIRLTDGRAFGAEPSFIPSLRGASREQLEALRASEDGVYLVVAAMDLHWVAQRHPARPQNLMAP